MTDNIKSACIRVLEQDAAQFEKMADSLAEIAPHLVAADRQWAESQVEYRRSLAKQHRALIELVKLS